MADTSFDVLIIGGGPGGYVAAIRAAQLGLKTAVVEREHLGGICLNWGCIPTKALLRSAEIFHYMKHAKNYGLSADNISFDAAAVVQRSRGVSGRLNGGVTMLLKKNKVTVIWGEAKLTKPNEVVVSKPLKSAMQPDTAVKTAETGYIQRRLIKSMESAVLAVCRAKPSAFRWHSVARRRLPICWQ